MSTVRLEVAAALHRDTETRRLDELWREAPIAKDMETMRRARDVKAVLQDELDKLDRERKPGQPQLPRAVAMH